MLGRAVLIVAVALAGGVGLAQVTVNAPKGILNRGASDKPLDSKPQEPAAGAPADHESQPSDGAQPKASAAGQKPADAEQDGKPKPVVMTPEQIDAFSFSSQVSVGTAAGYRVQVFFSSEKNAQELAHNRAREVALKLPHYRDYVSYVAPQWRLRVGDFSRREQADKAMRLILRQFPDLRGQVVVVRDHINLWH